MLDVCDGNGRVSCGELLENTVKVGTKGQVVEPLMLTPSLLLSQYRGPFQAFCGNVLSDDLKRGNVGVYADGIPVPV